MKKIKHWIRRNFGFSQREVNASLVLLTLLVLLLVAPFLLSTLLQSLSTFHLKTANYLTA
ncbi:hypothetical protein POKO110462_04220 [Pontibacter korlensis]|uniref:Uncharacterized protein n=1 Tax=Pontibacter korlensis TaxID=400092 RepID=A0A0E3UX34_9BACT|nr:hypothetical protein [Pontibacter korlensis]AKD03246.1 hypothetical protein PKOR_09040 [Pontibacter korlensis]